MRRCLWGSIVAVLGQVALVFWNLLSPQLAGPTHTVGLLLQYIGMAASSAVLYFLARTIRHRAIGHRALRGTAGVAMCLSALTAVLVLAALVCLLLHSPAEFYVSTLGQRVAGVTWLALAIAGLMALGTRPRPVLPAILLVLVFLLGITPQTLTLTTIPNPSNPETGLVGIQGVDEYHYDIPVPITITVPSDVGGPSMGLALALQVIDQLTPGGITGGWRVAATGEIFTGAGRWGRSAA